MLNSLQGIIHVASSRREQMVDITADVSDFVENCGVVTGICVIQALHTTAALTINENADPDVVTDMLMGLDNTVSSALPYRHAEGNSPAHIRSSLIGASENLIINNGKLVLGTWQGIYFCEFDGPRNRKVAIQIMGEQQKDN